MIAKLAPYSAYIAAFGTTIAALGTIVAGFGVFLQSRNNSRLNAELRAQQAEFANVQEKQFAYQRGTGAYFFFEVTPVAGANFATMTIKRIGTNPAYEASANFVDMQIRAQPKLVRLGTIGNDAVTEVWKLNADRGPYRYLTIFLTSRNAEHRQDVRLRLVNGILRVATRVVETYNESKVIYERIDSEYPRDANGLVNWSEI